MPRNKKGEFYIPGCPHLSKYDGLGLAGGALMESEKKSKHYESNTNNNEFYELGQEAGYREGYKEGYYQGYYDAYNNIEHPKEVKKYNVTIESDDLYTLQTLVISDIEY